ncbi:MAG: hypothetical protein N0C81_13855 [Candidatus Thiodiazotropha lotti]|nr:hypothetical protein [Candidatus Thiodiazotropha lotti]MCG8003399.1 hypothetical protein [Candidatus Thiodiazotropha lotti]MCG8008713.1 hypothetical protein [Candidatus Thiodiazotropha lotti]MCW4187020.1 hypothetical protein [Candidatus Thiodiazotropha lotti]MCW4196302.1 hypothetical protein [Candidatus Thiodiazotropha lotti]
MSDFSIQTDNLRSDEWSAEGIHLNLNQTAEGLGLQLTLSEFNHQALAGSIKGIDLRCAEVLQVNHSYFCPQGSLSIAESPYGGQQANVELNYIDSEHVEIKLDGLTVAQGGVSFDLKMTKSNWQLNLNGSELNVDKLRALLPREIVPPSWDVSASISIKAKLSGSTSVLKQADVSAEIKKLNYADEEGLQVAEEGSGKLHIQAEKRDRGWAGSARLVLDQGQYYSDPFYIDLTDAPLHLNLKGVWTTALNQLQLKQADLQWLPTVDLKGSAQVDLTELAVQHANIQFGTDHLDQLYQTIIQPMVIGSMADELEITGGIQGEIELVDGEVAQFRSQLKSIDVDDLRGVFALNDLQGFLAWSNRENAQTSQFHVKTGHLYQIPHGPLSVNLQALPNGISLQKPLDIQLLGGHIIIDRLEAKNLFHGSPEWETGAEVINLSLQDLSTAFDWPSLSGELNGKLPRMHYLDESLDFDGALQVDVFGGQIKVEQLKIKQPLGRVPELFASAEMTGLDLEQITRTFSFGHIEGGLEGWINGLHLLSWEPVAFQAQFNSPEDDDLPHRISQRAVDNLTSIGNGMGGSLQNTFLGIFKEFRYNRIELQASLDGDLAELGGIDHPNGGYYLVKGAGLPRIDVIARNRRVAWKTLVERLKNIRVEGMKVQ